MFIAVPANTGGRPGSLRLGALSTRASKGRRISGPSAVMRSRRPSMLDMSLRFVVNGIRTVAARARSSQAAALGSFGFLTRYPRAVVGLSPLTTHHRRTLRFFAGQAAYSDVHHWCSTRAIDESHRPALDRPNERYPDSTRGPSVVVHRSHTAMHPHHERRRPIRERLPPGCDIFVRYSHVDADSPQSPTKSAAAHPDERVDCGQHWSLQRLHPGQMPVGLVLSPNGEATLQP